MAIPVDHYAVMGNPIEHSKSPRIHAMFAESVGHKLSYNTQLVPVNDFEEAVQRFFNNGGYLGLSVTVPFKEQAWQLSAVSTARAEKAGAVNTLWMDEKGALNGDNTDGLGLVQDLTVNHGVSIKGTRVLVLGAGGAVRGVLEPIRAQEPSELVIANRTVSKAETLAGLFPEKPVKASGFSELEGSFDIIINGTSASLHGDLPPVPATVIAPATCCYDMMYSATHTVFNQWALDHSAGKVIDGLGMLVEQAAEQFAIWRGVRPETTPVLQMLRNELSGN